MNILYSACRSKFATETSARLDMWTCELADVEHRKSFLIFFCSVRNFHLICVCYTWFTYRLYNSESGWSTFIFFFPNVFNYSATSFFCSLKNKLCLKTDRLSSIKYNSRLQLRRYRTLKSNEYWRFCLICGTLCW